MSLKAGRVGVNPADVDPISGHISSSSTDAYSKAQSDEKFLSKTDAASTYETKSDASTAHNALQPKTLAVPIEMISGTKLTVETALQGLNSDKQNKTLAVPIEMLSGTKLTVETALQGLNEELTVKKGDLTTTFTKASGYNNKVFKQGEFVFLEMNVTGVTATEYDTVIATIPEGFRPHSEFFVDGMASNQHQGYVIYANGNICASNNLDNKSCRLSFSFLIDN